MPQRKPRPSRPSPHVDLYRDGRRIRIAKRVAHIAKKGGWSETPADTEPTTYPVHVGGGMFELSDGNRIKGKEAAEAAEADIDQQEREGD